MSSVSSRRSKNFTDQEKQIFLDLIKEHEIIIACKKTDTTSIAQKIEAWRQLTIQFNSKSSYIFRSSSQLKLLWKNMRSRWKLANEVTTLKTETHQTLHPIVLHSTATRNFEEVSCLSEQVNAITPSSTTLYPQQDTCDNIIIDVDCADADSTAVAEVEPINQLVTCKKCGFSMNAESSDGLESSNVPRSRKRKDMSLENVNEFKELLIAEQLKQMKDKHAREMAILDVQLQIKKAKLELLKKQISEPK